MQQLLAEHPEIIPGDQIDSDSPRVWLLVSREIGVPGEEGGGNRWSLDHLFVDQDGVPTLVEVKRSSDTRIRREVVGQMLDYAANATKYWPAGVIQQAFERRCSRDGLDPDAELARVLGDGRDAQAFWATVAANIDAGRTRLLFVADEIPSELRRVVEFLNDQMDRTEVLAVDVRRYGGADLSVFVPHVYGQTERARQKKSSSRKRESRQWDEASWFDGLQAQDRESETRVARALLEWSQAQGRSVEWGKGAVGGSFRPWVSTPAGEFSPFIVFHGSKNAQLELRVASLGLPPFDGPEGRAEFVKRIAAIDGVVLSPSAESVRPNVRLTSFDVPARLTALLELFDWVVDAVASHAPNPGGD